jgi:hypothetical protein
MAETDKPTERDMDKYREDVKTIREILVSVALELASYLRNSRRLALPFFTRNFFRIFAGLMGGSGVLSGISLIVAGVVSGRTLHTV